MWWIIWILFVILGGAFIVSLRAALRMERDRDRWRDAAEWLAAELAGAVLFPDIRPDWIELHKERDSRDAWLLAADKATGGDV